ncbi:MAG: SAM-dependent methyltransferase [Verrucomicrobiae bacterium]|nr:SAM-dependent methyltransferase [Verrucomicrobiae bacterium]
MNSLEEMIRTEIGGMGPLPFARFMDLALYHPEYGYYATANSAVRVGARGDFFTAISVGPLFGRILARQIARWWREDGAPALFDVVEWGAHDGQLARDLLAALEQDAPSCHAAVRYAIVEPLAKLADAQKARLAPSGKVRWTAEAGALGGVRGVILANELLDSLPFHIFERAENERELGVGLRGDGFGWQPIQGSRVPDEDVPLVWRGRWEARPSISGWLDGAAAALRKGRILLFDYGWTDEEFFAIPRPQGTARAYRSHHLSESLLTNPGHQDLTAHVRWTPVVRDAVRNGLEIEEFVQQGRWLTRALAADPWALETEEARQFHTLTHPDIMGEPFRVMVLRKG